MTPARRALAEAAAAETARIYGATCPEYRRVRAQQLAVEIAAADLNPPARRRRRAARPTPPTGDRIAAAAATAETARRAIRRRPARTATAAPAEAPAPTPAPPQPRPAPKPPASAPELADATPLQPVRIRVYRKKMPADPHRAAAITAAAHATGPDDCRRLLDILGLLPQAAHNDTTEVA